MRYTAAVLTISDKGARGERVDTSGPALCRILEQDGWDVVYTTIIPDEREQIQAELIKCADELQVALVLTTGGTGFSPRDITPEATMEIVERPTPGIPEAMRAESLKITPKGCLSRSAAGIRKRTLIINLPGSEKAAKENILAVLDPIHHGMDMLYSEGSADCGSPDNAHDHHRHHHDHHHDHHDHVQECRHRQVEAVTQKTETIKTAIPSMDEWLKEAKADPRAARVGMFLTHNGVVRQTAKAQVRYGEEGTKPVTGMQFSFDPKKVDAIVEETYGMEGIYYIRIWLNEGTLQVGDDIMYVLIGGDIRPRVIEALQYLVGRVKKECVVETEFHDVD